MSLRLVIVSQKKWSARDLELEAVTKDRDALLAEKKSTLDLSRRRLDESQAEIARLTEALQLIADSTDDSPRMLSGLARETLAGLIRADR